MSSRTEADVVTAMLTLNARRTREVMPGALRGEEILLTPSGTTLPITGMISTSLRHPDHHSNLKGKYQRRLERAKRIE